MWSKYHPFWEKLKASQIEIFSNRLEASVLSLALGLLLGFTCGNSCWFFLMSLLGVGLFYPFKNKLKTSFVILILTCLSFGVALAGVRLKMVAHPTLKTPLFQIEIQGEIQENLVLPNQQILTLTAIKWPRSDLNNPDKIELILKQKELRLKEKDVIKAVVSVFPLNSGQMTLKEVKYPLAYFKGIGARGEILKINEVKPSQNQPSLFDRIRQKITQRLFQVLPENQARIAIPLIIGEQKFVSKDQYKIYRQAGIVHVLSVSGFHMALLAGFLFFIIRGFCSLIPYLTLHFNAKKGAAVLAWIGTLFYLILSGCQIPALRSFGMISLVFLGILVDRPAFSKNSLFLLGLFLLLLKPENILSISFQLSFISVLILISVHEKFQENYQKTRTLTSVLLEFLYLNLAITVGLLPLIVWHFNVINPYGILGNMFLSVVFSFGIMPSLFVGCLMIPFGLESGFFYVLGILISWVERVAYTISQWPFSEIFVASFPPFAIGAVLFLCLYRYWGKMIALVFIGIALLKLFTMSLPDLLVLQDTIQWQNRGKLYQNEWGQSWLLNRWQTQRGFQQSESVALSDYLVIKDKKIALTPQACLGADIAFLLSSDSRCKVPTFIRDKSQFYQVFITPSEIIVQTSLGSVHRIKS